MEEIVCKKGKKFEYCIEEFLFKWGLEGVNFWTRDSLQKEEENWILYSRGL